MESAVGSAWNQLPVNHLAILICAVSIFLLGGPWYSKAMFQSAWAKASGIDPNAPRSKVRNIRRACSRWWLPQRAVHTVGVDLGMWQCRTSIATVWVRAISHIYPEVGTQEFPSPCWHDTCSRTILKKA